MDKNLKSRLAQELFFLQGVEEATANDFLESLEEPVVYSKGDIVCSPAMCGCGLGVLIKGKLEIKAGSNCASMRYMEPIDVFGAASLFGGGEYVSTLLAASESWVIYVSQEKLIELMGRSFRVAQNYINFLSEKVRFLNSRIENFTADCSSSALYEHLCRKADEKGRLLPPENMSKLARLLNMGRTSLYRAIEELETSGKLIRNSGEWIIIK
ncbi:MAG: Crp/Fnr family transcriptional regulator [Clostridia bacterium]|nr:Crp/Fnr family transcriptional regulator [Clostridia bacterium]